jgi:ArsR family transcriptional regulator, arsenate/arsenite/antimonite-responsive transcriptional repressor
MKPATTSFDRLAGMLSALGGAHRLRILHLLLQADADGLSVNAIKAKVRIPGSTLSHHLDRLKRHDLVRVEREGAVLRYAVNPKALNQVAGFLLSECRSHNMEPDVQPRPRTASRRAHLPS